MPDLIKVGFDVGGRDVFLEGNPEYLNSSEGKTELAKRLTNALTQSKQLAGKRPVMIPGFDMDKWFSNNKNTRIQYKKEFVTQFINSAIDNFKLTSNSGEHGKEIQKNIHQLIMELKKISQIENDRNFYRELDQLFDS